MSELPKVVVAMSGGVDSSVAAALLVEQGYPVIGMMLRLWSEEGQEDANRCCTPDAMAQARRVAAQLGIPFYAIDARQPFRSTVVEAFLAGYAQGVTPNPCIVCNRLIRWGHLLEHARAIGGEYLATGHYARLEKRADGCVALMRGLDNNKDQSYVLSALTQDQLQHTIFPLGELTKPQVRDIARKYSLTAAERADSQDLCFLAGQDYREFLQRHSPQVAVAGPIVNTRGEQVGTHQGLAFYTIGQRKGLNLSTPQPMYVIEKDLNRNALVVGEQAELGRTTMTVGEVNWISGKKPASTFAADVKIRYKAIPASAQVTPQPEGGAQIAFQSALRDITPGQLAVFYQGDEVIGSGIIRS